MKCPFKDGWEGTAEEYLRHYDEKHSGGGEITKPIGKGIKSIEEMSEKIILWHRTLSENIPKIQSEGLKPREECFVGNVFMDNIADKIGIPKERRRCKAVFLYFPAGKAPLVRDEEKEGIIAVSIEADNVFVSDMENATEAIMHYFGGPKFRDRAEMFAKYYWEEMMPYKEYMEKKPYMYEPECLVFEPIPAERIFLADMMVKPPQKVIH